MLFSLVKSMKPMNGLNGLNNCIGITIKEPLFTTYIFQMEMCLPFRVQSTLLNALKSKKTGLKPLPNVADLITGQRSEARVNTDWEAHTTPELVNGNRKRFRA